MGKIAEVSVLTCAVFLSASTAQAQAASGTGAPLVETGRQLAVAADCAGCHTAKGGDAFAGGYPVDLPLGTIWSTNITPSKAAGIGGWSEADFARALRQGVRPDGTHLYPAMPYDAYAGITDEDVQALYEYFTHAVAPVDQPAGYKTALQFPFDIRSGMAVWNLMYAGKGPFTPASGLTDEQNRGNYLVTALAHCGTCHTPRGALMQSLSGRALSGGDVGRWHAPNITPGAGGIGDWSADDIVTYLKTGRLAMRAQAAGSMAEAVENSLQYLPDSDLRAIAAYLKSVPPVATADGAAAAKSPGAGTAVEDEARLRGSHAPDALDSLKTGAELYNGNCASCHQPDGRGSKTQDYPSLVANSVTRSAEPTNLIAVMLEGVDRRVGDHEVLMPAFGPRSYVTPLDDTEIAAIATYVRQSFGGQTGAVSAMQVAEVRAGGPVPVLARVQPLVPYAIAVLIAFVLLLLQACWRSVQGRSRRRGLSR